MKAYLTPLAILFLILAFSLINCGIMVRETSRWESQLLLADQAAQREDWPKAVQALSDSYNDWSGHQTYLHIVIRHDAVDGAEAMYRRAAAFAYEQEPSEFRAEVADLCNQLRLLAEMERINIKNIL